MEYHLEGEIVVLKKAANLGLKIWDYCGMHWNYYCHCNPRNPEKLTHQGDTCPRCGKKVTHFREAGI